MRVDVYPKPPTRGPPVVSAPNDEFLEVSQLSLFSAKQKWLAAMSHEARKLTPLPAELGGLLSVRTDGARRA